MSNLDICLISDIYSFFYSFHFHHTLLDVFLSLSNVFLGFIIHILT